MTTVPRDVRSYIRPAVKRLAGFTPNKSPDLLKKKIPPEEIIKLNGNENPYGCSPAVNQALFECKKFSIYPDATQQEVRSLVAGYAGTTPDRVVAAAGADQRLDVIVRLFIDPGDEMITCVPTFELYRFYTQLCGGTAVEVQRDENFDVNISQVKSAITNKTKVIFLCNPNNPTGNVIPKEGILDMAKTGIPTVVDEAYYEFSGITMSPYIDQYPNLMVVRTFSKWAGIASIRLGYGIFSPEVAASVFSIKPPFSVSVPAIVGLKSSLQEKEHLLSTVRKIVDERERLFQELKKLSFLKPHPSKGNFIFCAVLKGEAAKLTQDLEDRGILIRHYNTPRLKHGVRITVGKPEQSDKLIAAMKELMG